MSWRGKIRGRQEGKEEGRSLPVVGQDVQGQGLGLGANNQDSLR